MTKKKKIPHISDFFKKKTKKAEKRLVENALPSPPIVRKRLRGVAGGVQ